MKIVDEEIVKNASTSVTKYLFEVKSFVLKTEKYPTIP